MRNLAKRAPRISMWLLSVGLMLTLTRTGDRGSRQGVVYASDPCDVPINPVVAENCKTAADGVVGPAVWDIDITQRTLTPTVEGFATDISVNSGDAVRFKIDAPGLGPSTSVPYHLDIYRMGYYGGNGARRVATVNGLTAIEQPPCLSDNATGLVDCGNWVESASWNTGTAVSGIYFAKTVVEGPGAAAAVPSHIYFIVRDDLRPSDVLFQTSDTGWQAYNDYGGNSLYTGNSSVAPGRAVKVSYNRPFHTRALHAITFLFDSEYPMVRWLEANGYDVSYVTGLDLDRMGNGAAGSPPATILATGRHHAFLSVGHDEYWSGLQRAHVEAARDTGTNLAFFSGNEIFWRTRWENSVDPADTPHRTLVCYKETHGTGVKMDPSAESTGTWRDPRFGVTGGRPENALSGTIFMVNGGNPGSYATLDVSPAAGRLRFWRNTGVAAAALNGQPSALPMGTLGYEWDVDADNGFRPAGLIRLSSTTRQVGALLQDFGTNYGPGTANHALTLYRRGDALVFGAGTVRWTWGLDGQHDADPEAPAPFNPSVDMQQATVNLLTDMGMTPATPTRAFTLNDASVDRTAPTSTITAPQNQANVQAGTAVLISGTALDGSSAIAGVEVSVDGGQSWHSASLTQTGAAYSWTYSWTPQTLGPAVIRSRASDDSANVETPLAGVNVAVDAHQCPCTIWSPTPAPDFIVGNDTGVVNGVELGVKFRADVDGSVSAVRFYKRIENTGSHVGHFWSSSDGTHWTLIASAAFDQESASGWQQASFAAPIPVNAGTTYLISYHNDNGYYAATSGYFTAAGHDAAPLHALQSGVDGPNGVFLYGALGDPATPITFSSFNGGNYWVDVVFDDTGTDTAPAAADESYAAIEDTAVNVAVPGVLANDADADGNALQVTLVTGPAHAAEFTLNRDGSFTYTPGLDYSGSDSFTYKATDGLLHSNLATVTISVAAVNDAPVADSGSPTTDEEVPVAITLTATDTDTPLSSLTFAVAVPPQHGQLSGVAPALIYTPDRDFNGIDGLTFRAHDGFLDSAVATVTVTVRPVNDPPIATAGTLSAVEDTPATGTLAATDVDGDTLSYSVVTQGSKGSVTITGGATYTYTPQANLNGQDSFTFKANDGAVDSTTVTVTVNITPVNDPPAANPDEVTVDEDSTNNMINALANDSSAPDPGETLTIVTVGIASHGTVTLVGPDTPGSRIRYAPQSLYHGPDSFTYTISDGSGGFATAVVSVTVRPVNHAPTVTVPANQNRAEGAVITVASGVAAGGTDPDGDPLTFDAVNLPAGLTINPANGTITGTIDYSAAAGSPYLVTVTVKDGGNLSATGSFTWAVSNTNRAPVVTTPGPQVGTEGQPVAPLAIAAHDDDTGDTVTYGASGLPNGLAIHATTGVISGTVGFDASTTNSVVVTVTDNHGAATSTAAFSWTITLVNRPPQIDPIPAASVAEGHTLTIAPTGSDPDGQTLSFSATGLPSGATFAGGIFTWTPGYDQARPMPYTVTFHVSDGVATASQPADITVTDTNRAPVLNSIGPKVIAEGQTLTITPSSQDADGQPVTLSVTDLPAGATFSGGTFTWTPSYSQAQAAPYNVTFTVTDGTTPVSETVAITVTNTNRAPVLSAIGPKTVAENATLSITPSATDADGDALSYSASGLPTGATFAAGIFNWTPSYTQAQAAPYNVIFTVTDGTMPVSETVAITVTNTNRAPVLSAIGPKTVAENTTLSITPSATDADGDSLTYSATGLPAGATFSAGTFTWTPSYSQAQAVPYNVTFTVTDGTTPVSEAVAITVTNTNRAPVLTAIGPKAVAENATLSITPSATDADGDSLTYSAAGLPTGATFNAGTFTWTPSYSHAQAVPYNVTFTVTDGTTPVSEAVAITVTNTNRAPVLTAIGPKTVAENATLSITPSATDADGDSLSYSATGLPTGATFNAGTFTWTPSYTQSQAAPYNVTFTVTDGATPVSEIVAITVTNTNRAPVLTAIGPKAVAENATLSITPSATDADGDLLTISATGLPTGATLSAGTFTWTPSYSQAQAAPYNVTFTVTDGTTPVSEIVAITVTNTNRPPTIATPANQSSAENDTIDLTLTASDPDGDSLTYTPTGLPAGLSVNASGHIVGMIGYDAATGSPYTVTIAVKDASNSPATTAAFSWTVANTNRPPTITTPANQISAENDTIDLALTAGDPDGGTLTFTSTGLPPGLSVNASGHVVGTIGYDAAAGSPYTVTITVKDASNATATTAAFTWTVANTNRPPAAIGDSYAVDEDQPLTVLQVAGVLANDTDADTDTLAASIVTAPPSAQGTVTLNGNGSFTFTPAAEFNGTASFTYKADDGKGGTANATVTVTVRSINDLPTISDTTDKTTSSGTATPALPITIGDVETSAAALTMSGGSSNLALVPVANIVFSGSGASRFVTITPIAGQSGAATITLTVTDTDAGARSDTFVLSVNSSSQPTTTTLTSPTASPTTYGAAIVLNAAVTSATGTPTGSVEFFEGPRSLGTATLTAGSASLTTTGIGAGAPTTVTAVYTPTGAFATSNGTLQRTINKAAASAVLTLSASPQAYSDLETFEATVTPQVAGQLGGTPVVTFKVGTQAFAPVALVQEGAVFKARLTVQLLEPAGGTGQMAPTTPTGRLVTATASGVQNYTVPNATKALVINKEDAQATYDGTTHAYTVGMNATDAAAVTLRATVKDITAADSVLDPNAGDISKATVFFYNRDTGVAISGAMPVTLVNSSDVSTGTATFNWAPTLGAANAQTFRIGVMVSSYYNRYAPADDALVTVSKPVASKFLTGDGQLTMATSSGLKAGTAGTKNDFGLGVTFTGTGAGPAGHFWTMMRSGANTYAVKSATLTSLVVSGTTAALSGTASIYDVTNGSVLVDGAATFTVTMTDGVPDQIGIVVRNGAGSVWFSSSAAAQQALSSGTVTIRP